MRLEEKVGMGTPKNRSGREKAISKTFPKRFGEKVVRHLEVGAVGSAVSATQRLSMLNPRPLKRPETFASTPNSFSTRTEMMCRMGGRFSG